MGFYVLIKKIKEEENIIMYQYGPNEENTGLLSVDKQNGTLTNISSPKLEKPEAYFIRASVKLRQCHQSGEYPNITCWAS